MATKNEIISYARQLMGKGVAGGGVTGGADAISTELNANYDEVVAGALARHHWNWASSINQLTDTGTASVVNSNWTVYQKGGNWVSVRRLFLKSEYDAHGYEFVIYSDGIHAYKSTSMYAEVVSNLGEANFPQLFANYVSATLAAQVGASVNLNYTPALIQRRDMALATAINADSENRGSNKPLFEAAGVNIGMTQGYERLMPPDYNPNW